MNTLMFFLLLLNASDVAVENEVDKQLNVIALKGIELELEGMVVCAENGVKVHDKVLKSQLDNNATLQDVVKLLGPGYLSPNSGTGGINWYFSDGSSLTTVLWPQSLNTKVKHIIPK